MYLLSCFFPFFFEGKRTFWASCLPVRRPATITEPPAAPIREGCFARTAAEDDNVRSAKYFIFHALEEGDQSWSFPPVQLLGTQAKKFRDDAEAAAAAPDVTDLAKTVPTNLDVLAKLENILPFCQARFMSIYDYQESRGQKKDSFC